MIQIPDQFAALLDTAPYKLQLTLVDGISIPHKAIKTAEWTGGSNSGDDITLGSTVATQMVAKLDRRELGAISLADARLRAELLLTAGGETQEIPWGVLQVEKPESDDDIVSITAGDAMLWAFSGAYDLDDAQHGFDWEAGVDGETLLTAICSVCGVALGTTGLRPITLQHVSPAGYTYREVIAFLACMWGRFARIDREGRLVLQWYSAVNRPVTPSRYYGGGLVKANHGYTVEYIKCYAEVLEETLEVGDTSKSQGIYIECPWMTPECLTAIWAEIGGFSYRPVSELRFLGDPRLDPGDVIQVTDLDGSTYSVPCMTLHHEFDGGLISEIIAVGKSVSASEKDYHGPVTRQIERAMKGVKATLINYGNRIEQKVSAGEVISSINQSPEQIKISADKVELNGAVTFQSFDSATQNLVKSASDDASAAKKTVESLEERANSGEFKGETGKDGADGEDAVTLRIESSRGTVFKNNSVSTVLSVVIYKGSLRITDRDTLYEVFGPAAYLEWSWQRLNETAFGTIVSTDSRIGNNGFTFTLSPEDVDTKVVFMCKLITD